MLRTLLLALSGSFLPLDHDLVAPTIYHNGYSLSDDRQLMVQKAYALGGLDFILMLECESGFNPNAIGDSGRSFGLCQMNTRWHKLPSNYRTDWNTQIEYCYDKRISGTKFYGPNRKINGIKCKDFVLDRFTLND